MLSIGAFARLGQVSPRMLRHYDELGLLRPEHVDPVTGYRGYEMVQLARLHRLVALRDLGFSLGEVAQVLDDDPPVDELRGMLRLRQAQLEDAVGEEQARLRRVAAHLRALEGSNVMATTDIVLKSTEPVHVAAAVGTAPGFGSEHLGPVFERLVPRVLGTLAAAGVTPHMMVAWYDEPADDGTVTVHAGFDIGDATMAPGDGVEVVDLPVVEVASVVHRGSMDTVVPVYEALVCWVEDSGRTPVGRSRELYLEWDAEDPSRSVTELQLPVG